MNKRGFTMISASEVARRMFLLERGTRPTDRELASFGLEILRSSREAEFVEQVIAAAQESPNVVVDGLRSNLAVERLQNEFGAIVVFVERISEASRSPGRGYRGEFDPDLIRLVGDVDSNLQLSKEMIDVHISNDSTIRDVRDRLLLTLQNRGCVLPLHVSDEGEK